MRTFRNSASISSLYSDVLLSQIVAVSLDQQQYRFVSISKSFVCKFGKRGLLLRIMVIVALFSLAECLVRDLTSLDVASGEVLLGGSCGK